MIGARAKTIPLHSSLEPSSVSNMCSTALPIIVSARCASLIRDVARDKKKQTTVYKVCTVETELIQRNDSEIHHQASESCGGLYEGQAPNSHYWSSLGWIPWNYYAPKSCYRKHLFFFLWMHLLLVLYLIKNFSCLFQGIKYFGYNLIIIFKLLIIIDLQKSSKISIVSI